MPTLRTLYRPVGLKEAELILQTEGRTFPPRLPHQPIFYPVLTFTYASQIARDWNTKDPNSGFAGFVTEFAVDADYVSKFEVQTVGASTHRELWVPAEELEEFNQHITGRIQFTDAFYGSGYRGLKHWKKEWYVEELFEALYTVSADLHGETTMNRHAILLNFKYWSTHDLSQYVPDQARFLALLRQTWELKFPEVKLIEAEK